MVLQSSGWNLAVASVRALAAVICALAAVSGAGGDWGRAGFSALAAVVALLALRTLFLGVQLEEERLVVRGQFRSLRLAWDEITGVAPIRRFGGFGLRFTLRGGAHVPVLSCGAYSRAQAARMASTIDAAARSRSARP